MVISENESKERREAGRRKELDAMSVSKRVHRDLTNGRPPASEFRTPMAAVTAAKTLDGLIRTKIEDETRGQRPRAAIDYFSVTVAFVTPDLSVTGFTPFYGTVDADRIERMLTGNIAIGLVFGIADETDGVQSSLLMGARPFHVTKLAEEWLSGLLPIIQSEMELDRLERQ